METGKELSGSIRFHRLVDFLHELFERSFIFA